MHNEILDYKQKELLSLLSGFNKDFYLAGGTAVALHLGHRRSVDFDMFSVKSLNPVKIMSQVAESHLAHSVIYRSTDQLDLLVNDVKLTFLEYPFKVPNLVIWERGIRLPVLADLAAMKSYALGRRSKWKDYVDIYFLLKEHFTITQITERATGIYGALFSEKLFRAQLAYYTDIDYKEPVDYMPGFATTTGEIQGFLTKTAIDLSL